MADLKRPDLREAEVGVAGTCVGDVGDCTVDGEEGPSDEAADVEAFAAVDTGSVRGLGIVLGMAGGGIEGGGGGGGRCSFETLGQSSAALLLLGEVTVATVVGGDDIEVDFLCVLMVATTDFVDSGPVLDGEGEEVDVEKEEEKGRGRGTACFEDKTSRRACSGGGGDEGDAGALIMSW